MLSNALKNTKVTTQALLKNQSRQFHILRQFSSMMGSQQQSAEPMSDDVLNFNDAAPKMPESGYVPPAYTGPSLEEMKAKRNQYMTPNAFLFYQKPLMIVDGKMQYLYDQDGKQYLDYFAGISTVGVGHCHPRVTSKVREQLDRVQHISSIYINDEQCLYAEELVKKLPEGIDQLYFTSSGSEANALATQMARLYTKNYNILTLKNGYHGHGGSQHLTNIGSWNHDTPKTQGVEAACFPDLYRGPFSAQDAPKQYGNQLKEAIDFNTSGKIAVFMAEPIQGVGGLNPLPQGFMQEAIPHVKAAGGLLLSDEVQTGFGRIGSHYWGCEMLGYKPDIITMAKQMGNGFPLAAVAFSKEVGASMKKLTFSTYGGNPLAMAAGREVIKVIDEEGMQENSFRCGKLMMAGLMDLKNRYEQVGDVRGSGLMMGLEIVKTAECKTPDNELFNTMFEKTKDYGLLLGKGGRFGNVFRIQPPMCITEEDVAFSIDVIERSLKESLK